MLKNTRVLTVIHTEFLLQDMNIFFFLVGSVSIPMSLLASEFYGICVFTLQLSLAYMITWFWVFQFLLSILLLFIH